MLPMCSSMWPQRMPVTACSAVMDGMPLRAEAERASAASSRPRTMAAAAAAFFLCSASVSALPTVAKSCACLAFIWSMSLIAIDGLCWPEATDLTRLPIPSCAIAMWWATTQTGHFSADVTFFHSASLSFSITFAASWTFASNCFASASAFAPMVVPPLAAQYTPLTTTQGGGHERAHRHQLRHGRELRALDAGRRRRDHAEHHVGQHRLRIPRRRPAHHAQDGGAGGAARRGGGRASRAAGSHGLRAAAHGGLAPGDQGHPPLPGGSARRLREGRGHDAAAREGARHPVPHVRGEPAPRARLRRAGRRARPEPHPD